MVNESFARHFFANPTEILGHHFGRPDRPKTAAIVVGIVRDAEHSTLRDPALPTCYTLFQQEQRPSGLTIYVRTWQAPDAAANSIRVAVAAIDSKHIVDGLSTMTDQIDQAILTERTIALLAITFGLLVGTGVYGILAYTTATRLVKSASVWRSERNVAASLPSSCARHCCSPQLRLLPRYQSRC